jgi:hypothetical protein
MDDATKEQKRAQEKEKESQARILAEKALFSKMEEERNTPHMRIVPCDGFEGRSKAQQAKLDALKKLYGL